MSPMFHAGRFGEGEKNMSERRLPVVMLRQRTNDGIWEQDLSPARSNPVRIRSDRGMLGGEPRARSNPGGWALPLLGGLAIGAIGILAAIKLLPGASQVTTLNTPSVTHNNPNSVSFYRTTANGTAFDQYAQGITVTPPAGWTPIVLGNNGAPVYSGPYGSTYLYVDVDGNTVLALLIHTDTGSGITYHSLSNMTGTAITVAGSMNVTLSPGGNHTA